MSINDKYKIYRPQIRNGDIMLVRGNTLLSKIIAWSDNAYFTHALLVFNACGRLFAIQSVAAGVQPAFLSQEIESDLDFCIVRPKFPQAVIDKKMNEAFDKAQIGIPYNFIELPKILLKEKFGINVKNIQGNTHEDICSVFTGITYGQLFPIDSYWYNYEKRGFMTPQDHIRWASNQVEIIGNDSVN